MANSDDYEAVLGGIKHLPKRDFSDSNLCNMDLSRCNFSNANFSGADLSGANLSGTNLSDANLSGANLSEADLSEADLSNANLSNANLSNTNLLGVNFKGTHFSGANLSGIDFSGANLSYADFSGVDLSGVIMRNTNLRQSYLSETTFDDADLEGADLRGAKNLTCEQLEKAKNWESTLRDPSLACGVESRSGADVKNDEEINIEDNIPLEDKGVGGEIPASDRVVDINHNDPDYKQAMKVLDEVISDTEKFRPNSSDFEDKDLILRNLKKGRALLQEATLQLTKAKEYVLESLTKLKEKFPGIALGVLAGEAFELFKALFSGLL